jgi:hypothetical protein
MNEEKNREMHEKILREKVLQIGLEKDHRDEPVCAGSRNIPLPAFFLHVSSLRDKREH